MRPVQYFLQLCSSEEGDLFGSIETSFISCFPSCCTLFPLKSPSSLTLWVSTHSSSSLCLHNLFFVSLQYCRPARAVVLICSPNNSSHNKEGHWVLWHDLIGIEVPEWGCLFKHVPWPSLLLKVYSQLNRRDASGCVGVYACICV